MTANTERRAGYFPALLVYEGGLQGLEFHAIANAFPLMEGDAFRELVEDIRKNGQQQPILLYEGKILDGRNRYRACLEAGEEPWTEPWTGKSPVEAVLSLNLHRRHLSSSQRAVVAERMLPHLEEEARRRRGKRTDLTSVKSLTEVEKPEPNRATAEAARLTGTNRQYVSDAKKLAKENPEMLSRVERGEVSLPRAVKATRPTEPLKGEDRRPVGETLAGEDFDLPPWDLPPERKEYGNVVKNLVRLSRLDPEKVALYCKGEYEAGRDLEHADALLDWFGRYRAALEARRRDLRPGNLRAVEGGRG